MIHITSYYFWHKTANSNLQLLSQFCPQIVSFNHQDSTHAYTEIGITRINWKSKTLQSGTSTNQNFAVSFIRLFSHVGSEKLLFPPHLSETKISAFKRNSSPNLGTEQNQLSLFVASQHSRGTTSKMERDLLQGHVVIGQEVKASNWKGVDLDWTQGRNSSLDQVAQRSCSCPLLPGSVQG